MSDNYSSYRRVFRFINRFQVLFWRLGLGTWMSSWPACLGTYMIITHYGRKSGKLYRTPLNFTKVNGEIYCAAGFGSDCDWYRNLQENPQVEIWHPDGWYVGSAEEVQVTEETLPIMRSILRNSGFVAKWMGLNAKTISDEDLMEVCRDYRLIHLKRTAPRTGRSGPGALVWIWPVLLIMALMGKCRRRRGCNK
jgi:deazaflavin-dependent oxidoreductase (nitroreductase family)